MERKCNHAVKRAEESERDKQCKITSLEEARQFWQKRTSRELTEEDIREIDSNLVGYFEILLEWHEQDLHEQSNSHEYRTIPS